MVGPCFACSGFRFDVPGPGCSRGPAGGPVARPGTGGIPPGPGRLRPRAAYGGCHRSPAGPRRPGPPAAGRGSDHRLDHRSRGGQSRSIRRGGQSGGRAGALPAAGPGGHRPRAAGPGPGAGLQRRVPRIRGGGRVFAGRTWATRSPPPSAARASICRRCPGGWPPTSGPWPSTT